MDEIGGSTAALAEVRGEGVGPALWPAGAPGTSFQYKWETVKTGRQPARMLLVLIFQTKSSRGVSV